MYLLYIDDSGSTQNVQEKNIVLGGLAIFERKAHWLALELDNLAKTINPTNPDEVEFHASEIFSGRNEPWRSIKNKLERIAIIKKVLEIFRDSDDFVKAFACVVHKDSFPGQDPLEIAFEDLCKRFDTHLMKMHHEGNTQRGLIICDKSSYETSLQKLTRNFKIFGTRWGGINNLAEVPLFVDSKATRLVQLADHVAYSVFRRYESGDASYLDIFMNKFCEENGILHSLVHKQTYNLNCTCPACLSRRVGSRPQQEKLFM